ncbi:hypothetical protein [Thioalkalivibrio sp. ALE16]|uniref:hypothetical protein n=1 Tax=Thioalkalivibrio sp. ALE16 TaxID=1158172 RepID=UPI0012DCB37E|nr:hypothetical protein [Thioalkalivibrio sp. ALE16]
MNGTLIPHDTTDRHDKIGLDQMAGAARDKENANDIDEFDVVFFYDDAWIDDPAGNHTEALDHGGRGFLLPDPWEAVFVFFEPGLARRRERRVAYGMGCIRHTPDGYTLAEVWPDVRRKAAARGLDFPFTRLFMDGPAAAEHFLARLFHESDMPLHETRIETRQSRVLAEQSVIREVLLDRQKSTQKRSLLTA